MTGRGDDGVGATVDRGFLGSGWAFPVRLDDSHRVLMSTSGDEAIHQAIRMILGTSRGERVMRPEFGCDIHELVFDVHDVETVGGVCESVREALTRCEPRIDVLDVSAVPDTREPNRLLIEINYQVRSDNSRFNLVYPFYLT